MTCIEAHGLRKTFGATIALDGVNLRVDEGRIVVHADAAGGRWLVPTLSGLAVADGLAAAFDLSLPN